MAERDEHNMGTAAHEQAAEEDADLRESLAALARIATGWVDLPDVLRRVAELCASAVPGADASGLTLLQENRADTVVASAKFVREIDAIQYHLGEGPCITASQTGRPIRSGSLGGARDWPRFGPRAGRLGVHSVMSIPLVTPEGVLGTLNVYAHAKDAFDERSVEIAEMFAIPAAISVQNADTLDTARRTSAQLRSALLSRQMIDQAVGIVMSRSGCTADEGLDRLRNISQTGNRKLAVIAQSVVDDAVARARARRQADPPGTPTEV